ncbi:MAG: hypothetical protein IMZ62_18495, partial [Chloroflexi bacterium]|nr:hypothetical protein [Chloroflexota bacterium]
MITTEMSVQDWFEELERGREFRRQYGVEDKWSEMERLFYNVDDLNKNSGPNLIMSVGDALMSALSVPVPMVLIQPRRE